MSERHAFFFGFDPDLEVYRSNLRAIEARVQGNYRVRCGHCGVSLCGSIGQPGPVTEVIWRHDGKSFYGSFDMPSSHRDDSGRAGSGGISDVGCGS